MKDEMDKLQKEIETLFKLDEKKSKNLASWMHDALQYQRYEITDEESAKRAYLNLLIRKLQKVLKEQLLEYNPKAIEEVLAETSLKKERRKKRD